MLRITDLSLPLEHSDNDLRDAVARVLDIAERDIQNITLVRRSVDARMRAGISLVYTVDVSLADSVCAQKALKDRRVSHAPDTAYRFFVSVPSAPKERPIIVGAGPCGLFAGLLLARLGLRPLILERGRPVRERMRDVRAFWRDGTLHPESNALFGEGGAGAFSDGKLTTQVKDREHRRAWILRELVAAGAPEEIVYSNKPHIGTNKLVTAIENLRATLVALGSEIRYGTRVTNLIIEAGRIRGVISNQADDIYGDHVLLSIGHSARDTLHMLYDLGVDMSQKAFSIGARIEHPQHLIDKSQYGECAGHPRLGAAEYKAVWHCRNGRSVYTFCMCPGGHVIAACNEPDGIATNGMSHYARKAANGNSGLLVGVTPEDYGNAHPLAGIAFQRRWEMAAYELGGGGFKAPVQLVRDVLADRATQQLGAVPPSYQPGVTPADLRACLPDYVIEAWREAIPAIATRMRYFDLPDAVLTGVETRSSSPVRMERDATGQCLSVKGLYPAGEGAGYAGGIMSSAIDGMRAAEQIAMQLSTAT